MNKKIISFLNLEISKDYMKDYKESLYDYINDEKFQKHLDQHIKDRSFSVFSLLEIFYPYFQTYDGTSINEWLFAIYSYANNLSYPHKGLEYFKEDLKDLYRFYLNNLAFFLADKDLIQGNDFLSKYPVSILNEEEEKEEFSPEYFEFIKTYRSKYINELMHLDMAITGHNTIDHVTGVNHVAMHVGRQLYELGLPLDLGVVVGASLGHDVGKYGVVSEEMGRVPYLHYYYTEEWFKRFGMEKIGHIATNHSTWDLELETLPIESLILIYADFRVKNQVIDGKYLMKIYSLDDSFDVILEKLDNVDEAKEKRYKKVYKRLKDFEEYMVSLGVDTSMEGQLEKKERKPFELMNKEEIHNSLSNIAIEQNIRLMAKLTDNVSFESILEMSRGETNWRRLRFFLQILNEYSAYLTQSQKVRALHLLYDLLYHSGEDIRKESAELIGKLIAYFDEEYRKELPKSITIQRTEKTSEELLDEFLSTMLFPDHKMADSQSEWIYNLKTTIRSLFKNSLEEKDFNYFDIISSYYDRHLEISDVGQFYLSQTIDYLPIKKLDETRLLKLFTYTQGQLDSTNDEVRISTLDTISDMLVYTGNVLFIASIRNWLIAHLDKSATASENYLKYIIGKKIDLSPEYLNKLSKNYEEGEISEIFFQNLKTATPWVNKKVNIDVLYDQVVKNPKEKGLHTSMHLCNILKVSAIERVRNYSGTSLLNIFHLLSLEERNDVAIELLRALEMESYQFTKFIPDYLGQILLYIPPKELDEVLDDFEIKIKTSGTRVTFLILNTIGIILENYFSYRSRFDESEGSRQNRIIRLLGLLAIGMSSYNQDIKSEGLRVISSLFKSGKLGLEEKYIFFNNIGKKVLTLLSLNNDDEFLFYNNVASLNYIYKYISDYEFYFGPMPIKQNSKIAFFPGSFDPFSLSHKEIAIEIRNHGFDVYMAVDEFSWSKRTEAHSFRRNIINMSISNERDIALFPQNIPINISNPNDLEKLRSLFPNREVYIVVGSDVLLNASAYSKEGPILDFSHIIFERKTSASEKIDNEKLEKNIETIRGDVLRLSLPPRYEEISSSQIRENIDMNRDISKFIDPLAQSYIYNYDLYLKAPQYKVMVQSKTIETEVLRDLDTRILDEIKMVFGDQVNFNHLLSLNKKLSYRVLLVRDSIYGNLLGFSTFYWVRQNMLYEEFKDVKITDFIRNYAKGRPVLISGICVLNNDETLLETVLNETLSISINRDYNFALYNNLLSFKENPVLENLIELQGFIKTIFTNNNNPLYMVDMNNPITLNLNMENILKPPFNSNPMVLETIRLTRQKLKAALSKLYPGKLLLTFNKDMVYSKLIQKICDTNNVPIIQGRERILGPNMCVPFGFILNGSIVPNTVTKTMHSEKVFSSSILDFTIKASPHYLSLQEQAKVLKSFNRPVILVDDILHKGYRINVIEPILREAGVPIEKVVLGLLTGKGKEFGAIRNLDLDSAYFIPNLKLWFNENSQYPFLGGDMVGKEPSESALIPSINLIFPYVAPRFIKGTKNKAVYNLSEVSLVNTHDLFKTLEEVYQSINEKTLSVKSLREVISTPRYPDIHKNLYIHKNIKPSTYIEMDLELLHRIGPIV